MLLLRHPLAALLNDGAHQATILLGTTADGHAITLTRDGRLGTRPKLKRLRERLQLTQSPSVPAVAQRCYGLVRHRHPEPRCRCPGGRRRSRRPTVRRRADSRYAGASRLATGARVPDEPD